MTTDQADDDLDRSGAWVSLFSGGKDSSFALYRALERGLPVERLLTVHPGEESYMYHVPETGLASLAAEAAGIDLVEVDPDTDGWTSHDSGQRGTAELEPLEAALATLDDELGVAGVTAGAIESEYQTDRIRGLCERQGFDLFAPLWQRDPLELGEEMLAAGFEIVILQVAADGLDRSWLGRRLDHEALAELATLSEQRGVHPLGEGGEFETFVVDGPHMDRRVELDFEAEWAGTRGRIRVTDARLV
jgi:ABC transporter with metal-binding/Fe-S-binding domain ATP-binding protein